MIELRPDEKGKFDELVGEDCTVHFEMMSNTTLWVSVSKGQQLYHLWVSSNGKLKINVSDEGRE